MLHASTKVTPAVSAPSSGVTMEQIQKFLVERDVYWVNWLSSKERESVGKKPETADEHPSVSTFEFYVPQPSAASIWDADELFQWSNCDTHIH